MHNKKLLLFAALVWTAMITVMSLVTLGNFGPAIEIPFKDKMVHFVFYFVFVFLWYQTKKTTSNTRKTSFIVFLAAVGYGLIMELFQSLFTTTRTADIFDAMANSLGAFAGLLFINNFLNKR